MKKQKLLKTIGKFAILILVIAGIAVGSYFILRACGFTTVEKFRELRDSMGESIWFWAIIVGLQIIQSVFIPISNSLISLPVSMIFNNEIWKVFLSSFIGIFIGNVILYFIGLFGGGKLLKFVLGDEKKADNFKQIMRDSKSFYLIAGVCPIIPSDVCNVIAGICNYNALFVIISTFFTRAICVATTCWLGGSIAKNPLWIIALVILLAGMLILAFFVTKKNIQKHKKGDVKNGN